MTIQERLKSFRMQVSSGIDAFCEELLKNGCKITAPTIMVMRADKDNLVFRISAD